MLKGFNNEAEAVKYAQEIDEQIRQNGAAVSNNLIYQNKDIERWTVMLRPHGKTLDDAVGFYVKHIEEQIKLAVIAPLFWHILFQFDPQHFGNCVCDGKFGENRKKTLPSSGYSPKDQ